KILYSNLLRGKKYIQFLYDLKIYELKNYLKKSLLNKKNICNSLFDLLELRLNNIVFKSGLAKTIPLAKQLINHGFIFVNKKKILKPAFPCTPYDIIERTFAYNKIVNTDFICTNNKI